MRRSVIAAALALLLFGCAHPLDVRNLDQYRRSSIEPLHGPVTIGVVPSAPDAESERLIGAIGGALGKRAARVHFPYKSGGQPVDVIARVGVTPTYEGSGWNFLINFPGFLVWAPAWNGYVYGVDYQIDVQLVRAADGAIIDRWQLPVALDIRHSSMGRTWTQVSWLEWGVIALVGGIAFIQYNPGVTELVVDKVEGPLGDYVAQHIVERVNRDRALWARLTPTPVPPSIAEPAVAVGTAPAAVAIQPAAPAAAPPLPLASAVPVSLTAPVAAAPVALKAGDSVRLLSGAALRTRATPAGEVVKTVTAGEALKLKASMRNSAGVWWYLTSPKGSGWARDSELEPVAQ